MRNSSPSAPSRPVASSNERGVLGIVQVQKVDPARGPAPSGSARASGARARRRTRWSRNRGRAWSRRRSPWAGRRARGWRRRSAPRCGQAHSCARCRGNWPAHRKWRGAWPPPALRRRHSHRCRACRRGRRCRNRSGVTMRSVRPRRTLSIAPSVIANSPNLFGAASVRPQRGAGKARRAGRGRGLPNAAKTARVGLSRCEDRAPNNTREAARLWATAKHIPSPLRHFCFSAGPAFALDSSVTMTSSMSPDDLWKKVGDFCRHRKLASCDREMRPGRRRQGAHPFAQGRRHGR